MRTVLVALLTQGLVCSRESVRRSLHRMGKSWRKAKKLLRRGDPVKRAAYVERLVQWLDEACRGQRVLVFIDEAHVHQDVGEGYGWFDKGQENYVDSSSPGLSAKVSFYGIYYYNEGQVEMRPYKKANGINTVEVLWHVAKRARREGVPVTLVWDGAKYHKSQCVLQAAEGLGLELELLPAYSPDLMPVELLWQWLRQEVTAHVCHHHRQDLIDHVADFERDINNEPYAIADRLTVRTHLDPQTEKRRVSM